MNNKSQGLELLLEAQGVEGEFLFQERRNWLPIIVPPLVHRLNNSLLVLASPGGFPGILDADAVYESEYNRLRESLRCLSYFARSHAPSDGLLEVGALTQNLEYLAMPWAKELGVELDLRVLSDGLSVRGDIPRIQQWLLCLVLTLADEVGQQAGRQARALNPTLAVPRLRLSVHLVEGHVRLRLAAMRPLDHGRALDTFLDEHQEWCVAQGMQLSVRHFARSSCYQIGLPLSLESNAGAVLKANEAHRASAPRSLVLVQPDDGLRDLLGDLLESESYRVQCLASASGLSTEQIQTGVLLIDLDSLRANPGIKDLLLAARESTDLLLLLGTPLVGELEGPWAKVACLPKPIRPDEFLSGVGSLF